MTKAITDPVYLSILYRLTGTNFRLAAEILHDNMELRDDGVPAKLTAIPFYYLVSHAVELLLKSALLKRGSVESETKKLSHNLRSLLQAVRDKGVVVTPETIALIEGLHPQHQTHALRYDALLDDGKPSYLPPPASLFVMLDELLMLTRISTQGV